jgi:hypothetical protein
VQLACPAMCPARGPPQRPSLSRSGAPASGTLAALAQHARGHVSHVACHPTPRAAKTKAYRRPKKRRVCVSRVVPGALVEMVRLRVDLVERDAQAVFKQGKAVA